MWVNDVGSVRFFVISLRSPGVNLHFEICPSLGWSLGSLSTNFYTNSARSKKQGKKAAEQAAKLGTWHSGCDPLLCSQSATGLWVFSFVPPPPSLCFPKHTGWTALVYQAATQYLVLSFLLSMWPQAVLRSKKLEHGGRAFCLLWHFRGVWALWCGRFDLHHPTCGRKPRRYWFYSLLGGISPVWSYSLLPRELREQRWRLKAPTELGHPVWGSCSVTVSIFFLLKNATIIKECRKHREIAV